MAECFVTIPIETVYVTLDGEEHSCRVGHAQVMDRFHNEKVFMLMDCQAMITKLDLVSRENHLQLRAHVRVLRAVV